MIGAGVSSSSFIRSNGGGNTNKEEKNNADELLNYLQENDIVDISYMRKILDMESRKKILNEHPYQIWQASDGYWKTYLLNEGDDKRKIVKRKNKKDLEDLIVSSYKNKDSYTFSSYFAKWENKQKSFGVSNNTLTKYKSDYKRFFKGTEFENADIRKLDEEDITAFMIRTVKGLNLKEKAGSALWGYVSGVFKHARIKRVISENPCEYVEKRNFMRFYDRSVKPVEKRTVSDKDLELLIEELHKKQKKKPEYIPAYAVELAIHTGMRVGELAALKWENIKYNKEYILIDSSEKHDRIDKEYRVESTKTNKERRFPISDEIKSLLTAVKKIEMKEGYIGEYVFMNENGRVTANSIAHCIRYQCKKAGIEEKSIHALRRTLNSKMRVSGVSPVIAASLLGHSERINESNYTYDISEMGYKKKIISEISKSTSVV